MDEMICEICDRPEDEAGTLFPRRDGSLICRDCLDKLDAATDQPASGSGERG